MAFIKKNYLHIIFIALLIIGLRLRVLSIFSPNFIEYDPHLQHILEIKKHYTNVINSYDSEQPLLKKIAAFKYSGVKFASDNPDNFLKFHPPAHHISCALLLSIKDSKYILKIYSLICTLLTICFLYLILAYFLKGEYLLILLGLNLLVFLPSHILFSSYICNDVLFVPLCTLFLLLSFKWDINDRSYAKVILLGLLSSVLLLTKHTGLLCFIYLNAILFILFISKKIRFLSLVKYVLLVSAINIAIAGWFYWMNFKLYGNPIWLPGLSSTQQRHFINFINFKFIDLFTETRYIWHESDSILTGFFVSFFSFDWDFNRLIRQIHIRNAVFALSFPVIAILFAGLASGFRNNKYLKLNVFSFIAFLSTVKFLLYCNPLMGPLKSKYMMFIAPAASVYFAEGCGKIRQWNKLIFYLCILLFIISDIIVIVYYHYFSS